MDTSLIVKSVEQGTGRKLQKTITDVNPAADGTALKTFAQGLNALTTNTYTGTTKINIDNLLDEGDSTANPLPAPKVLLGQIEDNWRSCTWYDLAVVNGKASWTGKVLCGGFYFMTDSEGAINAISWPPSSIGVVGSCEYDTWYTCDPPEDMVADMAEKKYYMLACMIPDYDDPDCLGKFVFQIDATDTHSSVTITINATSAGKGV